MLKKIKNCIYNIIKYGIKTNNNPDTGNVPTMQVAYLGKTKDAWVLYPYGMHANAPINSVVLLHNVKGNEENQVGIASKPEIRPKGLKIGEVVFGNFVVSSIIKFKEDGDIDISPSSELNVLKVTNFSNDINVSGDSNISGDNNVTGNNEAATYSAGGTAGVSGTFISADSTAKTITVTEGLITDITP